MDDEQQERVCKGCGIRESDPSFVAAGEGYEDGHVIAGGVPDLCGPMTSHTVAVDDAMHEARRCAERIRQNAGAMKAYHDFDDALQAIAQAAREEAREAVLIEIIERVGDPPSAWGGTEPYLIAGRNAAFACKAPLQGRLPKSGRMITMGLSRHPSGHRTPGP